MVITMIIHIIKNNESVKQILSTYNISIEELKLYNKHITDFNNLLCGMKLKIPLITEEIEQVLDYSEGFITTVDDKIKDVNIVEEVKNTEKIEEIKDISVVEEVENKEENIRFIPYPGIKPPKSKYRGNEIPK